jgi:hypothetical protein
MKSLRSLCSLAVLTLAFALFLIVLPQSSMVAHAGHLAAISNAQMPFASFHVQLPIAAVQPSAGQPAILSQPTHFDSDSDQIVAVRLADLNNDGKLDLVIAGNGPNSLNVLLGNGDGTFQPPVGYALGQAGTNVAIGDVNGDGHPDIVFAYIGSAQIGAIAVLLGNGDGTFQSPTTYASGAYDPEFLSISDMNGDGHPDIVVGNRCGDPNCDGGGSGEGLSILFNIGSGTFAPPVNPNIGMPVLVTDLNGDGKLDIIAATGLDFFVSLGNGDGTFQSPMFFTPSGFPEAFAAADMNGDGKQDLILSVDCSGSCPNTAMNVFLGNGDGTFQAPIVYPMPNNTLFSSLAIADMNGDGTLDVVGINQRFAYVVLGLGGGNLNYFQRISTRLKSNVPPGLAVADINADGRPDVVAGGSICTKLGCTSVNNVETMLNRSFAITKTAVTASPNPAGVNQSITLTATIASGNPVPNGAVVTFFNGKVPIGTGNTVNGVATLTTSFPKAKTYSVKATYPGDDFRKSSTGMVREVITP